MLFNKQQAIRYLAILLILLPVLSAAQSLKYSKNLSNNKDWSFVENKGQIAESTPYSVLRRCSFGARDQRGTAANEDIRYYGHQEGIYLYCKPGMISFIFTKVEKEPEQISEATGLSNGAQHLPPKLMPEQRSPHSALRSTISTSRMDLVLMNSNPAAQILASDQQEYYENYYTTGSADSGITNVHTYKTLTYKNLYPHIDMILSCREKGMEYSFVVYPDGKVSDIQVQWDGVEGIKKLKDFKIEYSTNLGKIDEGKPVSFQGGNKIESSFERDENKVGFKVGKYDRAKVLVIDPMLEWGTYFGGSGYSIATDTFGNVYIAGTATNYYDIATKGAYQTSYGGTSGNGEGDAFIAKFNSNGKIKWATYYGGSGGDAALGVATDDSGNVYITGNTQSDSGIATRGAYQTSYSGSSSPSGGDAFLAKFNGNGGLQWGTYFGGNSDAGSRGIAVDHSANIYITGTTASTSGIATGGAYQTSSSGANVFLAKFNKTGKIQIATYYALGGVGIATDNKGNVYVTGDGLAKFSPDLLPQWAASTYSGFPSEGIATDSSGNIYVTGVTESTSGIATRGTYQFLLSGVFDAYLAKFDSSGNRKWGTYFGGNLSCYGTGVATDKRGYVYLTGWTDSKSGIATNGAYQTSFDGTNDVWDAFLAKFLSDGTLVLATYYGGSKEDRSYGVSTDNKGSVYLTGITESTSKIATPGAYLTTGGNGFLAKFNFTLNDAGITAITNPTGVHCADTFPLTVILKNYGTNTLKKTDINWSVNGKLQKVYHWSGSLLTDSIIEVKISDFGFRPGMDTIRSWTSGPNGIQDSVPDNDSAMIVDKFNSPVANYSAKLTNCGTVIFNARESALSLTPVYSLTWTGDVGPGSAPLNATGDTVSYQYNSPGTYHYSLLVWGANGCTTKYNDSITIPKPSLQVKLPDDTVICRNTILNINAVVKNSIPPYSLKWNTGLTGGTIRPLIVKDTFFAVIVRDSMGCTANDSMQITTFPLPDANAGQDQIICAGLKLTIGSTAINGHNYSWQSSPFGFTSTLAEPSVTPVGTTTYTLTEINANGCVNSNSVTITVNNVPGASVKSDTAICAGSAISIGAAAVNGSSYTWMSSASGFSSTSSNPTVSPFSTASYTITETNANGCENSNSVTITVNPLPAANAGSNETVCQGKTVAIGASNDSGSRYIWSSFPAGFSSTIANPVVRPISSTTYILTETNTQACSKTYSIKITILLLPKPVAGPSKTICSYDTITIGGNAVNGYTYYWHSTYSNSYGTASFIKVNPAITTWFYVAAVDSSGCIGTDSVLVYANPLPKPSIIGNLRPCQGLSPYMYSTPSDSATRYSWTIRPGSIIAGQGTDSVKVTLLPGFNNLLINEINRYGCSKDDDVSVYEMDAPSAHWNLLSDSPNYIFKASDTTEQYYQWLFGDNSTNNSYLVNHKYDFDKDSSVDVLLTVSSANGCSATFDSVIKIHNIPPPSFYIDVFPNPFSQTTKVKISLEKSSHIQISAYDAIGRYIGKLDDIQQPAGVKDYVFNASQYSIAYGVYYFEILVDGKLYTRPAVRVE